MDSKPRLLLVIVVGLVVAVGTTVMLLDRQNVETAPAPRVDGPVATIATEGATPQPSTSATSGEPPSSEAGAVASMKKTAEAFVTAYYAYSYRDRSPNAFLKRAAPHMTKAFVHSSADAFGHDDPELSQEWKAVKSERRSVSVVRASAETDPWYTPSPRRAVMAVTFAKKTTNAIGTGGVGEEITQRVLVVKVGGRYLVDGLFDAKTHP